MKQTIIICFIMMPFSLVPLSLSKGVLVSQKQPERRQHGTMLSLRQPFDPSTGLPSTVLGTGRAGRAQDKAQDTAW